MWNVLKILCHLPTILHTTQWQKELSRRNQKRTTSFLVLFSIFPFFSIKLQAVDEISVFTLFNFVKFNFNLYSAGLSHLTPRKKMLSKRICLILAWSGRVRAFNHLPRSEYGRRGVRRLLLYRMHWKLIPINANSTAELNMNKLQIQSAVKCWRREGTNDWYYWIRYIFQTLNDLAHLTNKSRYYRVDFADCWGLYWNRWIWMLIMYMAQA